MRKCKQATDEAHSPFARLNGSPIRIQLSRKKGWRMPPNTVKVDRSTEWGNPFQVADIIDAYDGNQAMAQLDVACSFEQWLHESEEGKQMAKRAKELLRGKDLACWCKCGSPCHADVLLRVANTEVSDGSPSNTKG